MRAQLDEHLDVERVEFLGAIERERREPVFIFAQNQTSHFPSSERCGVRKSDAECYHHCGSPSTPLRSALGAAASRRFAPPSGLSPTSSSSECRLQWTIAPGIG